MEKKFQVVIVKADNTQEDVLPEVVSKSVAVAVKLVMQEESDVKHAFIRPATQAEDARLFHHEVENFLVLEC